MHWPAGESFKPWCDIFLGMPTKITLQLHSERDFRMPRFTGHIARALVLHMIRMADPAAALELHQLDVLKPFAVEPLYFKAKEKYADGYLADCTSPCRMVVKVLDDSMVQEFVACMSSSAMAMIRDCEMRIGEMRIEQRGYCDMGKRFGADPGEAGGLLKFGIRFETPTLFAVKDARYYSLFPEPELALMNLLRVWNKFSGGSAEREIPKAFREWVRRRVGVVGYELAVQRIMVDRAKARSGFTGWVKYEMADKEYAALVAKLLDFAEYSNVGKDRTAGFGVAKAWMGQRVAQPGYEKNSRT